MQTKLKQDVITETIREWVLSGKYAPGEKLPTDAELAAQFLVNRCTVAAGLNRLAEENLLDRAPRRGTTVKKPESQTAATNAVALISIRNGELYGEMVRKINGLLQKNGLFPVLIESELANNREEIISFLNQMTSKSRPFGYIALGDGKFPYEELKKNPRRFRNVVFLLRYHWYEYLPQCKYALIDYDDLGRQVVEYFARKNIRRILFPAVPEKYYMGAWSSKQVQIMNSIKLHAAKEGIQFDDGLFWRMHSGAPAEDVLPYFLDKSDERIGIYMWSEGRLTKDVFPVLRKNGSPDRFVFLGTFNTKYAEDAGFDSFDMRKDELAEIAVEMLTGKCGERKILLPPKIVKHTTNE